MMKVKKCPKCGRILPVECFYKNAYMKDGLQIFCKECEREHRKEYNRKNKKEMKKNTDKKLLNCFVTIEPAKQKKKKDATSTKPQLSAYPSNDLLRELKTRGYVWDNLYVKQSVDYASI